MRRSSSTHNYSSFETCRAIIPKEELAQLPPIFLRPDNVNTRLSLQHIVSINPEILSSQIDDEVVLLNIEIGKYIGLNPIASIIWEQLKEPIQISSLTNQLTKEYDVPPSECEEDTLELLQKMLESQLITIQH